MPAHDGESVGQRFQRRSSFHHGNKTVHCVLKMRVLLLLIFLVQHIVAFAPLPVISVSKNHANHARLFFMTSNEDDNSNSRGLPNPFKEIGDMFANFDDVVDDFFYKRMGNGETFYGKRKYKPSGKVEGEYNGMGLTDKLKIDISRERKELFLEEKRLREEEAKMQKRD